MGRIQIDISIRLSFLRSSGVNALIIDTNAKTCTYKSVATVHYSLDR